MARASTAHMRLRWSLWSATGVLLLTAFAVIDLGHVAAQSPPSEGHRPEEADAHPQWAEHIPELRTSPEGRFNRARREIQRRRDRIAPLVEHIEQTSRELQQLHQHTGPNLIGLHNARAARDLLAEMHRSVDELVQELEGARDFTEREVIPHLGEMLAEVRAEKASLPARDPNLRPLVQVEGLLMAWEANPRMVMDLFDRGPAAGMLMRTRDAADSEEAAVQGWRIRRHLQQLEEQQRRLRSQLEQISGEIERLRAVIEGLSPEELRLIEERLAPGRSPMIWQRFNADRRRHLQRMWEERQRTRDRDVDVARDPSPE